MRLNSFHLPPDQWPDQGPAVLRGAEARHLAKVLRHTPGDTVRLFDGAGREGLFTVAETSKSRVHLDPVEITQHPHRANGLVLALGFNKSSRRGWLLEKSVEFQAGGVAFWQGIRSQGRLPNQPKESWDDKLVQAAKQCGNPWLPQLAVLDGGAEGVTRFAAGFDSPILLWESQQTARLLEPADLMRGRTLVVVGPEGGLDDSEAKAFMKAGFKAMTLGDSVLRWETAALHCLSLGFAARQAQARR